MAGNNRTISGVYLIYHLRKDMGYVGSSVDITHRIGEHIGSLEKGNHHCRHLQNAWKKYGADAFEFKVLEDVSTDGLTVEQIRDVLLAREQHHLDEYLHSKRAFNACPKAGSSLGRKTSEEHRRKVADAMRKRWADPVIGKELRKRLCTPEHMERMHAALRGKPRSEEHKAKISAGNRGSKRTPEQLARMSAAHLGNRVTEESKRKISAALAGRTGRSHSEEARAKISAANKGRKRESPSQETRAKLSAASADRTHSAETRAKLSAAAMGRRQTPESNAKNAAAHRGKKQRPEVVAKRAEKLRGNTFRRGATQTKEARQKISLGLMGNKNGLKRRVARGFVQGRLFE